MKKLRDQWNDAIRTDAVGAGRLRLDLGQPLASEVRPLMSALLTQVSRRIRPEMCQ